jgi:uncharacterized protein YjbI with pentapeptide repeats
VILLGAYFTYRQLQTGRDQLEVARRQAQATAEQAHEQLAIAQQGQVTERFTRAIDQLGSPATAVRTGGVYALEGIARDSDSERGAVVEVLTAFVRQLAPWPPKPPWDLERVPKLQTRAPDVQAAMRVLGRARWRDLSLELQLNDIDLRVAYLPDANLQRAFLHDVHLEDARIRRISLQHANLRRAHLQRALLGDADLSYAVLPDADLHEALLERADLSGSNLSGANLRNAKLTVRDPRPTHLAAVLAGANLSGADLRGADLGGADLGGANLSDANLSGATADQGTTWPEGFDWHRAGVRSTSPTSP